MEFLSFFETNKNKVVAVETFLTAILFRGHLYSWREEPLYGLNECCDSEMRISIAVNKRMTSLNMGKMSNVGMPLFLSLSITCEYSPRFAKCTPPTESAAQEG